MKKIYYILTLLLCVYVQTANAQMGVNSTGAVPNAAAMLDVRSSDKGFLMPRLTTTQRNAMPAITDGLMIYNVTTAEIEVYRGLFGWQKASRMGVPFSVSGSDVSGIVQGYNTGAGSGLLGSGISGPGVYGTSSTSAGVSGNGDKGVFGNGTTFGVYGSSLGTGVFGETNSYRGVWGRGLTTGDGVYGDAISGKGVYGLATGSGTGVYGNATAGGTGVQGISISGNGGFFQSDSYRGLEATSLSNYAVLASNNSATVPVAQFANLSGGTALELVAVTALKITGAIKVAGGTNSVPAFKIVSVAGNIFLNQLIIPNATQANNINDIVMITHNYGAGATNNFVKPCGVYWEPGTSTWRIFVEDGTAMPVGITFNVLVIKQ
jgi:hypothetical protein